MRKRDFLIIGLSFICLSVFIYHFYFLSNSILYNAISYVVPLLLLLNLVLIAISIIVGCRGLWLVPVVVAVLGWPISQNFFAWSVSNSDKVGDIRVLSYNVGTFNLDRFHAVDSIRISDSIVLERQKQFLLSCDADIVCLQEFYNNDALGFSTILSDMASIGYKYFYMNPKRIDEYDGFFGVITFSKFPIVDKGKVEFDYSENKRALNTAIYTDVLINEDTFRIINVHLHSMDLRVNRVIKSIASDTAVQELDLFKQKMEYGFMKRGEQVLQLEKLIKEGGKIILVGDLNDLPFSFSYQTLKKYLKNAFEEKGFGFGFTYNKFPWFIRIDNQFCSPNIKVVNFEIGKENNLSDHFPLTGVYSY